MGVTVTVPWYVPFESSALLIDKVAEKVELTEVVDVVTFRFEVDESVKETGATLFVDRVMAGVAKAIPPAGALIVALVLLGLIRVVPPVAAVKVTLMLTVLLGPVSVIVPVQVFGVVTLLVRQVGLDNENCIWEGVVKPLFVMKKFGDPDTVKLIFAPELVTLTDPDALLATDTLVWSTCKF